MTFTRIEEIDPNAKPIDQNIPAHVREMWSLGTPPPPPPVREILQYFFIIPYPCRYPGLRSCHDTIDAPEFLKL